MCELHSSSCPFCERKRQEKYIGKDPVGESLSADPDALQHTVTAQLVHDQRILHRPRSLTLIGDDAAHKVRVLSLMHLRGMRTFDAVWKMFRGHFGQSAMHRGRL